MTLWPPLRRIRDGVRIRRVTIVVLRSLPWIALAGLIGWRLGQGVGAGVALALGGALLLLWSARRLGAVDAAWLIRALDRSTPQLQDSSDLLVEPSRARSPLQQLQRVRMQERLALGPLPDLREAMPWTAIAFGATLALALGAALWYLPWRVRNDVIQTPTVADVVASEPAPQSMQFALEITPPAYTGRAARRASTPDVQFEQDSLLSWTLQFAIAPQAARLRFVDGSALELESGDAGWRAQRSFDASTLYRIELDGAAPLPEAPAHRLEMIPDRAPRLSVIAPERTLTVLDAAQPRWSLTVDAEDDYGLGGATLELTLAQGSGEQVTVSERRIRLRGDGDAQRQRFAHAIDLAALGFAEGDDLIARLEVRDNRTPTPNASRSASFILRWPATPASDGSGVEGLVQQAMPAYFRSQRQIIIDTEALIAERPRLGNDALLSRSDALGVDQRILRLRYGQFLGEEAEDVASAAGEGEETHHADDGHDHGDDAASPSAFGDAAQQLIAGAGHLHDLPEAATLLDPDTRRLLRSALAEMWQAELELRLGKPEAALPFEYRALDYIKRVQQANRIYLARVGLELPQLDASRRLTGERPRHVAALAPAPRRDEDAVLQLAWNALQSPDAELPLAELQGWTREARAALDDPLALLAELDALQRDPACVACRARLSLLLWPLLPVPPAAPMPRTAPDAMGRAWLDALAPEDAP